LAMRQEYPRPDFVRDRWLSLNGPWQFTKKAGSTSNPETVHFDQQIEVPFVHQSRLSGVEDPLDTAPVVWYRRDLEIPSSWQGKRIRLHFGAVDHEAFVWINGCFAGSHRGGYTPFSFDITDYLQDDGNQVTVKVVDENITAQPRGKQSANLENWGCWYTRVTGIWQSVWLEPVAPVHIKRLRLRPNVDEESLNAEYQLSVVEEGLEVEMVTSFQGDRLSTVTAPVPLRYSRSGDLVPRPENQLNISVNDPKLWSPETPHLYDLTVRLKKDGDVIDEVDTYFAMRKVELRNGRFYLNNRPYYLRMVLDQGFWPDGIYTAGTLDDIEKDVKLTKASGFNGARKHQKIEDPYFYHFCDREGLLVWAEMPSCYIYDEHNATSIMQEWQQIVRRLYNFPSIVAWVPMNESWGVEQLAKGEPHDQRLVHHLESLYHATKAIDAHRPVVGNDGWEMASTDIIAIHDYTQDADDLTQKFRRFQAEPHAAVFTHGRPILLPGYEYEGQPIMITEYGGVKVEDENREGWGYGTAARSIPEMLNRMKSLTDAILEEEDISGYCYTQLTDVQQEINGLFDFQRKIKAAPDEYAKIFGRNPQWWPRR